ncbi:response regulator [Nostoc sp. FACHB-145]|uniref:response regulator n=1 Tax=Nostoc sp. FACHB-145 TaxID=2692836 RepID=UPI001688FBEC|nr:response regulator [Nostoc sp. FACHB-145]MBD2468882.1 response regulator [Nostoc sp. FACHB-145]
MSQKSLTLTTILLVEPDDTVRPILRDNLRLWGYNVIVTLDAADALQRTKSGGELFDLILLNQFSQSLDQSIDIGRYLRQQAELSRQIPIVVMAERYGVELEGQDIQVGESEYVTYLEDGQQLKNLLHRLCPV